MKAWPGGMALNVAYINHVNAIIENEAVCGEGRRPLARLDEAIEERGGGVTMAGRANKVYVAWRQ